MNPSLNPTPLKKCRHAKGWRLVRVKKELIKIGTPVSWPTLVMVDNGYRSVKGKKKAYKPNMSTLIFLGKLFKKKPKSMYKDRSKAI